MENLNFLTAFLAGLVTFFAPCTFVTLPSFIAYLSFRATGKGLNEPETSFRLKILLSSLSYVAGFLLVFIVAGMTATQLGSFFSLNRDLLEKFGAIVIIFFGLFILIGENFTKLEFLYKERKVEFSSHKFDNGYALPFVIGLTSAFAWTPCIGPILGSILFLAGSSAGTVWQGGLLLFVYGLGITLPFLLFSIFLGSSKAVIRKFKKGAVFLHRFSAIVLILIGIIILLGLSDEIFSLVFKLFVSLGYRPA